MLRYEAFKLHRQLRRTSLITAVVLTNLTLTCSSITPADTPRHSSSLSWIQSSYCQGRRVGWRRQLWACCYSGQLFS